MPKQTELIEMVIVMDRSGSMKTLDPEGLSIPSAVFILDQLSLMNEENQAAIVMFSDQAAVLGQPEPAVQSALTRNIAGLMELLDAGNSQGLFSFKENAPENPDEFLSLLKKQTSLVGETEMGMALKLAGDILDAGNPDKRKIIVLISDGLPDVDYKDKQRLDQLGVFADLKLIDRLKKQKNLAQDRKIINRQYQNYILEKIVTKLRDRNIAVLPVAFLPKDSRGKGPFIEYLEKIRQLTTGDTEFPQANSSNLIKELMGNISMDRNYILLHKLTEDKSLVKSQDRMTKNEADFTIPGFAQQVRFFFSFPDIRTDQQIQIELFRENIKMADSQGYSSPNGRHVFQKRHNGSIVFHSFRFHGSECDGKWKVVVTDISKAQAGLLPEVDCLVDIKANLELEITTSPSEGALRAKDPVEFRFNLMGRKRDAYNNIPLTRVDVFLLGRQPESIGGYSDKIRTFRYEGVATGLWKGFQDPGTYLLKGWAYFQPEPNTIDPLRIYFEKRYQVKTAVPVEAWFSTPLSRDRLPGVRLELPTIGENTEVGFSDLLIRTNTKNRVSNLTLLVNPLVHNEMGTELEGAALSTEPASLRGLSESTPLPFSIRVTLPDVIPATVPDGLYRTSIILKNGPEELDILDIYVPVLVPRFVQSKENMETLFKTGEDNPDIVVEKRIYYPGTATHTFSIPLWSSANADITAFPFFLMPQGLEFSQKDTIYTARPRNSNVLFSPSADEFLIPGKNSSSPGRISVDFVLKDNALNQQSFTNSLTLSGAQHRSRDIKLIAHINFIPKWYMALAVAGMVVISGLLFLRALFLWNRRNCFQGFVYEGDDEETVIRHGRQRLGRLYRQDSQLFFDAETQNRTAYLTSEGYGNEDDWQEVTGPNLPLNLDDMIRIESGRLSFEIIVDAVPGSLDSDYSYRVVASPYGTGRRLFLFVCPAVLLLAWAVWTGISPYAMFRLLNI
ncbi:MAG: VWA domain-containing protein [Desulfotignum sp.]|nr:VWA domain-containing protein [Desulfotignum sp.]